MQTTGSDLTSVAAGEEAAFTVLVDGRSISARAGQTVAAVLGAAGIRVFRRTAHRSEPRGLFCGIGICYECLVTVNGVPNVRACVTAVAPGMSVETGAAKRHGDGS